MRAICEFTYDALCESNELRHAELRKILLQMARMRFALDGEESTGKFLELGDKILASGGDKGPDEQGALAAK